MEDRFLGNMDSFMQIFNLLIGVLATYYAITGKGYAYKNDYPEEIKAEANALLRKFLWFIGPFVLVFALLEYFAGLDEGTKFILNWVQIGGVLIAIIVYVIMFRRRFGKIVDKSKKIR